MTRVTKGRARLAMKKKRGTSHELAKKSRSGRDPFTSGHRLHRVMTKGRASTSHERASTSGHAEDLDLHS